MPIPLRRSLFCASLLLSVILLPYKGASAQTTPPPNSGFESIFALSGSASSAPRLLKDLAGSDWKRVRIGMSGGSGAKDDSPAGGLFGALFGGGVGGALGSMLTSVSGGVVSAGDDVYYTRGQTVSVGTETFLLAFQPRIGDDSGLANLLKMSKGDDSNPPPAPKPMTGEIPLNLVLLNVRSFGKLTDIRPFVLTDELAASAAQATMMGEMIKSKGSGSSELSVTPDPFKEETAPPPKPAKKPTKPRGT